MCTAIINENAVVCSILIEQKNFIIFKGKIRKSKSKKRAQLHWQLGLFYFHHYILILACSQSSMLILSDLGQDIIPFNVGSAQCSVAGLWVKLTTPM